MSQPPPLLGDGKGHFRLRVVGNSGSGKSTLGRHLATRLGIPFVSMDHLHWNPGWKDTSAEELKARLAAALADAPSWVVEGNYHRVTGPTIDQAATDIVWLDPPLLLYFPRLVVRTFLRLFGLREQCSPGCPERWREVFLSKESILWWCLSRHGHVKKRCGEMMRAEAGKMRRIGGWGAELREWLSAIEAFANDLQAV